MQEDDYKRTALDADVCSALSNPTVFADLFNGTLFGGKQVISPESLRPSGEKEIYKKPDGKGSKSVIKFRDVKMVRYDSTSQPDAILAVEAQKEIHFGMPVRVMTYDAMAYSEQIQRLAIQNKKKKRLKSHAEFLSGLQREDKLLPVFTIVFFYGDSDWLKPIFLSDVAPIPKDFMACKNEFTDYKIKLITCETVEPDHFQTGLREVFELLRGAKSKEKWNHLMAAKKAHYASLPEEKKDLVAVFLDIPTLRVRPERYKNEGGYDMCTAIEEMVRDGEIKGEIRGRTEGEKYGRTKGEERYNLLLTKLLQDNRINDLQHIVHDKVYRDSMFREYGI